MFQRVLARPKIEAQPSNKEFFTPPKQSEVVVPTVTQTRPPVETSKDPLSRMADLAKSLRSIAAEAEEIALDMEARANQLHNDTAKLRQLQELLKGLGA